MALGAYHLRKFAVRERKTVPCAVRFLVASRQCNGRNRLGLTTPFLQQLLDSTLLQIVGSAGKFRHVSFSDVRHFDERDPHRAPPALLALRESGRVHNTNPGQRRPHQRFHLAAAVWCSNSERNVSRARPHTFVAVRIDERIRRRPTYPRILVLQPVIVAVRAEEHVAGQRLQRRGTSLIILGDLRIVRLFTSL